MHKIVCFLVETNFSSVFTLPLAAINHSLGKGWLLEQHSHRPRWQNLSGSRQALVLQDKLLSHIAMDKEGRMEVNKGPCGFCFKIIHVVPVMGCLCVPSVSEDLDLDRKNASV